MKVQPRRFEYRASLDRDGHALAEGGPPLALTRDWTPEHLVLAGLVACSIKSLKYHARRAEIQRALAEELATASTVRPFNPKERYKAGEIISHPEYGRGKIENVLRASLLVRFSRSGLKPLSLL